MNQMFNSISHAARVALALGAALLVAFMIQGLLLLQEDRLREHELLTEMNRVLAYDNPQALRLPSGMTLLAPEQLATHPAGLLFQGLAPGTYEFSDYDLHLAISRTGPENRTFFLFYDVPEPGLLLGHAPALILLLTAFVLMVMNSGQWLSSHFSQKVALHVRD